MVLTGFETLERHLDDAVGDTVELLLQRGTEQLAFELPVDDLHRINRLAVNNELRLARFDHQFCFERALLLHASCCRGRFRSRLLASTAS